MTPGEAAKRRFWAGMRCDLQKATRNSTRSTAWWLGEFADVVEDLLHRAGIVEEGDDPPLTVADGQLSGRAS